MIILSGRIKAQSKQLDQAEHVYCVSHSVQVQNEGRKDDASMDRISAGERAEIFQIRPHLSVDQALRFADGVSNVDESSDLQLHAEHELIAGVDGRFVAWQRLVE